VAGACYKEEEFLHMSCWISIAGGLLIMMGQHARSEALFYYFRLEDQVPENHLLRLIEKHIRFEFVRERLKDSYSETGRPSIDPELLLRILLIGYLYGVTSERKLVEELRMHLAWRWFTGLGFDQEIPHHSTFSKNRHGRFQASKLFEQLFEEIVRQCVDVGLVQGEHLSVDGSLVEANAAKESRFSQLCRAILSSRSSGALPNAPKIWRFTGASRRTPGILRTSGCSVCDQAKAKSVGESSGPT
jgi:transposase